MRSEEEIRDYISGRQQFLTMYEHDLDKAYDYRNPFDIARYTQYIKEEKSSISIAKWVLNEQKEGK